LIGRSDISFPFLGHTTHSMYVGQQMIQAFTN
jgi:hypothetical protein